MILERCLQVFLDLYLSDVDDDLYEALEFATSYSIKKGYIEEDHYD